MTIDNYKNLDEVKELKKIFLNQKEKLVAFVGAGASVELRIKNWTLMLEDMVKIYGLSISVKSELKTKNHAQIAQQIFDNNPDQKKYNEFMKSSINSNPKWGSLQNILLEYFKIILTTNFDESFENCAESRLKLEQNDTGKPLYKVSSLPNLFITRIHDYKYAIIHLHGCTKQGLYIFKEDEYKRYYNSPSSLLDFLKPSLMEYSFVFVGFSFIDEYFVKVYERFIKEEKQKIKKDPNYHSLLPKHFILLEEKELVGYFFDEDKKQFNNDSIWNKLFVNKKGRHKPVSDIQNIIKKLSIRADEEEYITNLLNRLSDNQKRLKLFANTNKGGYKFINIIRLKSYEDLEDILLHLNYEEMEKLKQVGMIYE